MAANPELFYNIWGFGIIIFVAEITSFIILFQALGQVQGFSAWRALGNVLLAGLIAIIPLMLLIFCIILGMGTFAGIAGIGMMGR